MDEEIAKNDITRDSIVGWIVIRRQDDKFNQTFFICTEPLTVTYYGGGIVPLRMSDMILGVLPAEPHSYELQGTVLFDEKEGWKYGRIGSEIRGANHPAWGRALRRQRKFRRGDI